MSDIRVVAGQTPIIVTEGQFRSPWAQRDGSLVTVDWIQALVNAGLVYVVNYGADTTPIALETAYDADQPDLCVDSAAGIIHIPLSFEISPEATGAAGFECHIMVSPTAVGAGTSTALTPQNLLVGSSNTAASRASRTYTGNGTDPSTNARWLANFSVNQDLDAVSIPPLFRWNYGDNGFSPVIKGAGSFNAYMYCGTSGTAFARYIFAEIPSSMSGLLTVA